MQQRGKQIKGSIEKRKRWSDEQCAWVCVKANMSKLKRERERAKGNMFFYKTTWRWICWFKVFFTVKKHAKGIPSADNSIVHLHVHMALLSSFPTKRKRYIFIYIYIFIQIYIYIYWFLIDGWREKFVPTWDLIIKNFIRCVWKRWRVEYLFFLIKLTIFFSFETTFKNTTVHACMRRSSLLAFLFLFDVFFLHLYPLYKIKFIGFGLP